MHLKASPQTEKQIMGLTLAFAYPHINAIKILLESYDSNLIDEQYEENILMRVEVPEALSDEFTQAITNLCSGAIDITEVE